MTNESIFDNSGNPVTNNQEQEESTSLSLIGEGNQYRDIYAADKALAAKEEHIKKLEAEAKEREASLATATTVDDILAKINTPNTVAEQTRSSDQNATPGITAAQINAIVDERVASNTSAEVKKRNLSNVEQALINTYGQEAYAERYKAVEAELLLSKGIQLTETLGKDPSLVSHYFPTGAKPDPATSMVHQSSINTSTLNTGQLSPYQKMNQSLKGQKMTTEKRHQLEMAEFERQGPAFLKN